MKGRAAGVLSLSSLLLVGAFADPGHSTLGWRTKAALERFRHTADARSAVGVSLGHGVWRTGTRALDTEEHMHMDVFPFGSTCTDSQIHSPRPADLRTNTAESVEKMRSSCCYL